MAYSLKMKVLTPDDVDEAVCLLKAGEIVAFPTETVYGLGVSLDCEEAIKKLFLLKNRAFNKPFTAHVASWDAISEISQDLPDEFYLLAEKFWPGPLTLVVKKSDRVSSLATGGKESVGIRWPDHATALSLLKKMGTPLLASSANISGLPPAIGPQEIKAVFSDDIAAMIDGGISSLAVASTVISLLEPKKPRLLREGTLFAKEIINYLDLKINL